MSEKEQPISHLTDSAMSNLRSLIDVNSIIGDPITTSNGVTIIPVSKVSFGYASGGADLPTTTPEKFAGGTGGGVTIQPLAFLVVTGSDVKVVQIPPSVTNTADRLVDVSAGVVDRLMDFIPNKKPKTPDIPLD